MTARNVPRDLRVWARLLNWRMEPTSRGRYRAFRDELGYWMIAGHDRMIIADRDLTIAKQKARAIIEAET